MKTIVAITCLLTISGLFANTADAGHDRNIDDLASSLKRQASQVTREIRYHFRHTSQFRHLYKDAYELYCLTDTIHDLTHHREKLCLVHHKVEAADALIHHIEDLTDAIKSDASRYGRHSRSGHGGFYVQVGYGQVRQRDLQQLCEMMKCLADTVHKLDDAVESTLRHSGHRGGIKITPPAPPTRQPQIGPRFERQVFGDKRGRFSFSIVFK